MKARIIHIDRFGNCITNITRDLFEAEKTSDFVINGKTDPRLSRLLRRSFCKDAVRHLGQRRVPGDLGERWFGGEKLYERSEAIRLFHEAQDQGLTKILCVFILC